MSRVVVRKTYWGYWVAGIEGHPLAASTHPTWQEAMDQVPVYVAIADVQRRSIAALDAEFDRRFPAPSALAATEDQ